ncbi:MAG: hypothetical protein M1835_004724 [Candelina submexicana]|nr:MAG: hypothetical protein M1835_004724 [Candelina submexicana]
MSGQSPPNGNSSPPFYGPSFPGGVGRSVILLPPGAHPPILEVQPGDLPPVFYDPVTGAIWDPIGPLPRFSLLSPLGMPPVGLGVYPESLFYFGPLQSPLQATSEHYAPQSPGQVPWVTPDLSLSPAAHGERDQWLRRRTEPEYLLAQPSNSLAANPIHSVSTPQALTQAPLATQSPTGRVSTATTRTVDRNLAHQRDSQPSNDRNECEFDPTHSATEVFRGGHYCNDCLELVRISLL